MHYLYFVPKNANKYIYQSKITHKAKYLPTQISLSELVTAIKVTCRLSIFNETKCTVIIDINTLIPKVRNDKQFNGINGPAK